MLDTPFLLGKASGKSKESGIGPWLSASGNQSQRLLEAWTSKECSSLSKLWGDANGSKENKSLFVVFDDPVQIKKKMINLLINILFDNSPNI